MAEIDASSATKAVTATEAPHLDTTVLLPKQDNVAKAVDLDVSAILDQRCKDADLGTVSARIPEGTALYLKLLEVIESKGLFRYGQNFDQLLIEERGQLLCYNELSDKPKNKTLGKTSMITFLSLFLFWTLHKDEQTYGHLEKA